LGEHVRLMRLFALMQINTRRVTGQGDVPLAVRAMKAGAVDFIEKPFASEAILSGLEAALLRLAAPSKGGPVKAAAAAKLALLASRELQVLQGLLAGLPSKSIAYDFGDQSAYRRDSPRAAHGQYGARSLSELIRLALAAQATGSRGAAVFVTDRSSITSGSAQQDRAVPIEDSGCISDSSMTGSVQVTRHYGDRMWRFFIRRVEAECVMRIAVARDTCTNSANSTVLASPTSRGIDPGIPQADAESRPHPIVVRSIKITACSFGGYPTKSIDLPPDLLETLLLGWQ